MWLGRDRESDVSSGRMAMRNHFLPSARPKIWLGRSREIDFSRGWKSLRYHFLLSGRPYMRLERGRESDVSWGRLSLRTNFLISGRLKKRLGRVRESVSRGRMSMRPLSAFWPSQNATWVMSRKRLMKGSTGSAKWFSAFLPPKLRLGRGPKALILVFSQ
jgi:hypothetical protein